MSYYNPTTDEAQARRLALAEFDEWNGRALLAVFALFGVPPSYLDLGCGTGAMVHTARRLGVDAVGVDVIAHGPGLVRADLTQPLDLGRTFALVSCIEVAEHLEEQYSRGLVDTIARHTEPGGLVVFTAAQPGQPGDHHVTLHGSKWWEALLYEAGLNAHREYTLALSLFWRYCAGPLGHHLPANLTVYHKGGA